MFQAGEKILYPLYGICSIQKVEEKEILGVTQLCYIMKTSHSDMQISIPVNKSDQMGIRKVVKREVIDKVLSTMHHGETDPIIFENQRYSKEINKKKLKTGDIYQSTEIIRDLTRKGKRSKLCPEDVTMLGNARHVFLSEMMEVKGLAQEQAVVLLDEILRNNFEPDALALQNT